MHARYDDIISRLGEPLWWDENGTPRYCEFVPGACADIYASEAVLLLIRCQGCGREFEVAQTFSNAKAYDYLYVSECRPTGHLPSHPIADAIREGILEWGDPPNTDCCDTGPSMTSTVGSVLQYWHRDDETGLEWVLNKELMGDLKGE